MTRKTAATEATQRHQDQLRAAWGRWMAPDAISARQAARKALRADLQASRPKELR